MVQIFSVHIKKQLFTPAAQLYHGYIDKLIFQQHATAKHFKAWFTLGLLSRPLSFGSFCAAVTSQKAKCEPVNSRAERLKRQRVQAVSLFLSSLSARSQS